MLLEVSVLCMMQKTGDLNGHLLLRMFLADDYVIFSFSTLHYVSTKVIFQHQRVKTIPCAVPRCHILTSVLLLSEVEQESLRIKLYKTQMCAYICISHMNWSVTVPVLRNFDCRDLPWSNTMIFASV